MSDYRVDITGNNLKQRLNIGQFAQEHAIKPAKVWRLFNYCVDSGQFQSTTGDEDQFFERNKGYGQLTLGVYPEKIINFAE